MYLAVTVFFVALFVGLVWPVYPVFATVRPFVLGIPFSLAYVVILLLAGFAALLGLYLWEGRRGLHDPLDPGALDGDPGTGGGTGDAQGAGGPDRSRRPGRGPAGRSPENRTLGDG